MRTLRSSLTLCAALAVFAACGGSQPPIGASGVMPQSRVIATQAEPGESWTLLAATAAANYKVGSPLLYVTNYTNNVVKIYPAAAKDPRPIASISSDIAWPSGDCLDSHGTLYVTNQPPSNGGWVSEYPLGKTKASAVIKSGIVTPAFCAVDSKDDLWVTNIGGPSVTEYVPDSKKPHTIITKGLDYPVGIAIDSSGNLYVANRPVSGAANVVVYPPGSNRPTRTITDGMVWPVGIGIDSNDTLYVTNLTQNSIEEYLPGQDHPYQSIMQGLDAPVAVVLNTKGWLYVANFGNSNNIIEFAPGSITPSKRHISKGLYAPEGVAYYPPLLP